MSAMTRPQRRGGALLLSIALAVPTAGTALAAAPRTATQAPAAVAASADLTIDVGATVGQPWSLTIRDARGDLLRTVAGPAIVVTTPGGPVRATTVTSSSTNGPTTTTTMATERDGLTVEATVSTTDGVVSATLEASDGTEIALDLRAQPDERFLGLGERSETIDHRGRRVENRVLDGPYTPRQSSVVSLFVPEAGFSTRTDATYFPVPWVLSTAGYGLLLDNDEDSAFELATEDWPDAWRASVESRRMDLRVFGGPTPADVLEGMTAAVGRQPAPSAPFVHGPWWQPEGDAVDELRRLRAEGVPVSLAQTYTHYLPCGDENPEAERRQTSGLHAQGVAVTTYVNPMMCTSHPEYAANAAQGAFTKNADGTPLVYRYSTATNFQVSQFDFSAEPGRNAFASVLGRALGDGYDGWMEDFGEYTPDTALSADGTPGPTMHNRYVEQYRATAHDVSEAAPRPLARYSRAGWTDAIKESEIVWGGDPTTTWGFDGLESSVRQGLTMGLSGVSVWGSDIGGFFTFFGETPTAELTNRWIELGAVSGVMRLQSGGINLTSSPKPSIHDPEIAPVWERYSRLRTRLYPYLAGSQEAYQRTGMPLMRHLSLVAPEDQTATAQDDEFMLGADVLAAPVVTQGATDRRVYLPEGRWVDLWRSVTFDDEGRFEIGDGSAVLDGRRHVDVPAPVGQVPLFVRSGAVVPLVSEEVETLSDYGDDDVVGLDDRSGRTLLAFPSAGEWQGTLGEGERLTSTVTDESWVLDVAATEGRTYEVQGSLADLDESLVPTRVTADGEEVDFEYDAQTRSLTADATVGATGQIVVSFETEPDPEPTDPEPTDPEPTDPEPTDPEPTDPTSSPSTTPTPTAPAPPTPPATGTPSPSGPPVRGPIIETDVVTPIS